MTTAPLFTTKCGNLKGWGMGRNQGDLPVPSLEVGLTPVSSQADSGTLSRWKLWRNEAKAVSSYFVMVTQWLAVTMTGCNRVFVFSCSKGSSLSFFPSVLWWKLPSLRPLEKYFLPLFSFHHKTAEGSVSRPYLAKLDPLRNFFFVCFLLFYFYLKPNLVLTLLEITCPVTSDLFWVQKYYFED